MSFHNTGFIVQARMASSRLPGKTLMSMPFGSKETILSQICNTLKSVEAKLIVATSIRPENDPIADYCVKSNIICYRGDENNVLSRFYDIQERYNFTHIFRFTADNPLIDIDKLKVFFNEYLEKQLDYSYSEGMPLGMNFEVFKGKLLNQLPIHDLSESDKEHVTQYLKNCDKYKKSVLNISTNGQYRMTVDTPIDYAQLSLALQVGEMYELDGLSLIDKISEDYAWILELNSFVLQNNNYVNPKEEIKAVARFLEPKGYEASVEKLIE